MGALLLPARLRSVAEEAFQVSSAHRPPAVAASAVDAVLVVTSFKKALRISRTKFNPISNDLIDLLRVARNR